MTIKYNVPGSKRKELVKTIAAWLGEEIKYCGAPTFAYEVDYFTIDRNGCLFFDDRADSEVIERLLEHLYDEGFECEEAPKTESKAETTATDTADDDTYDLNINLPRSLFTETAIENLQKLVKGKESLLKKALGTDSVPVIVTEETVSLPWFTRDIDAEHCAAYTCLITSICKMAKEAKRVTAKEKDTDNPKYAFRCFLLRLGFIGDEFKMNRNILLENLSGSSAFKSKAAKCVESEVTE